jgi:hypothetical protein
MTTAHVIQVPVESLGLIELPGIGTFQNYKYNDALNPLEAQLTLKTPASTQTFRRRVRIWNISTAVDFRDIFEDQEDYVVLFRCLISGQEFSGRFDYKAQKGELVAYEYDPTELPEPTWSY